MKYLVSLFVLLASCQSKDTLFQKVADSGIDFKNTITESDTLNALTFDYLYNGGGVGIGDLNGDGKPDVYMTGNQVSSKLYLNTGDLKFRDVTAAAGVGTSQWATGVSLVDINADGRLDMYVCITGTQEKGDPARRTNRLFVNQGNNAEGVPTFREMAAEYNLADTGWSTQAAFFDYDRDGDLDCYLLSYGMEAYNRNAVIPKRDKGEAPGTDRLYINAGNIANGHPLFREAGKENGILLEGYGLGVTVSDLNQDGWLDVYAANDFLTNDLMWLNQRGKGMLEKSMVATKHQTYNGMGVDVADLNNDGLPEIMVVDMLPGTNERKKMMLQKYNYDFYEMARSKNYEDQYIRNTLQEHRGFDANGDPMYSEVGQMMGIHSTDWSWGPLMADFDNDGLRDIFITNGYRRDITNLDFVAYLNDVQPFLDQKQREARNNEQLKKLYDLPEIDLPNYLYHNTGDLNFEDKSAEWGFTDKTYSNGAAYADLDGDGDLDLVVNNIDQPAGVYRNTLNDGEQKSNFLRLKLTGTPAQAIGAKVWVWAGKDRFLAENQFVRGFQSSVEPVVHLGMGQRTQADSIQIDWADGTSQRLGATKANQTLAVAYKPTAGTLPVRALAGTKPLFTSVDPNTLNLSASHLEYEFADFKTAALLPQQYSKNGPGMAVGDVNGDGLDDVFIGADFGQPRVLHIQRADGTFLMQPFEKTTFYDDNGAQFFDADGDGDLDLYVVSGGSMWEGEDLHYQDRLFLNDGKGKLDTVALGALPNIRSSGYALAVADYDGDGDLDVFRGGRVVAGAYPTAPRSYLLKNMTRETGKVGFVDATPKALQKPGMVTGAQWVRGAGKLPDLVLVGEWMVPTRYANQNGTLTNQPVALTNQSGFWCSLTQLDVDGDGDQDLVAGNIGLNTRYAATEAEPIRLYAADFDANGRLEAVMTQYTQGKEHPVALRDVLVDQMPTLKKRFTNYIDYAKAELKDAFTEDEIKASTVFTVNELQSVVLLNDGNQTYRSVPLPRAAQVSPVNSAAVADVNRDGKPDLVLVGNSYAPDPQTGRFDAGRGLVLLGSGRGTFAPLDVPRAGLNAHYDARAIAQVRSRSGTLWLVANNNAPVQVYR